MVRLLAWLHCLRAVTRNIGEFIKMEYFNEYPPVWTEKSNLAWPRKVQENIFRTESFKPQLRQSSLRTCWFPRHYSDLREGSEAPWNILHPQRDGMRTVQEPWQNLRRQENLRPWKSSPATPPSRKRRRQNNTHTQKVIQGDQVKEGNKVTAKARKAWGIHSCYIRAKKKSWSSYLNLYLAR